MCGYTLKWSAWISATSSSLLWSSGFGVDILSSDDSCIAGLLWFERLSSYRIILLIVKDMSWTSNCAKHEPLVTSAPGNIRQRDGTRWCQVAKRMWTNVIKVSPDHHYHKHKSVIKLSSIHSPPHGWKFFNCGGVFCVLKQCGFVDKGEFAPDA